MVLYRCGGGGAGGLTPLTPSNSSPVAISSGGKYEATAAGYAIASYSEINTPGVFAGHIQQGSIVKALADLDYAGSITTIIPSDTNPPYIDGPAGFFIGGFDSGYVYKTQQVGGFPYTVQGTLVDFTAANQEKDILTGLDSITYFYIQGFPASYIDTMISCAWLDTTKTFAKQVATNSTNNGTTAAINSGTNADGVITATGVQIKISAISGGTVTIKTGNSTAYRHVLMKWWAG